jgi:hypothetical protein
MAEFRYYGTWDDSWEILSSIIQLKEYDIHGDIAYRNKKTQEFLSKEDMNQYLFKSTRCVFISQSDLPVTQSW